MVQFAITDRIISCLEYVLDEGEQLSKKQRETFQSYKDQGLKAPIPLTVLNELAECSRSIGNKGNSSNAKSNQKSKTSNSNENKKPVYWFHELIEGSEPIDEDTFDTTNMTAEQIEKEKKRRELKKEAANREYQKMIDNLTPKEVLQFAEGKEMKMFGHQAAVGFNILISMITLFVCGWWVFSRAYGSQTAGVFGGLFCAIGIMIVEVWLFIIRSNQIEDDVKNKVKRVQQSKKLKNTEREVLETYSTATPVPSSSDSSTAENKASTSSNSWLSSLVFWNNTKQKKE